MAEPQVSAVIPVYNGERHLAAAIESVLAQSRPADEVIVVDDGSTDRSGDVARNYEPAVRCVAQARAGPAAARNRGASIAGGDHLALLDADDLWEPEKLKVQLEALSDDREADLAFGHVTHFHSPDMTANEARRIPRRSGTTAVRHAGAMLARRRAWDRVGPLDVTLRVGDFLDWLLRADAAGLRSLMVPHIVMRRRLHPGTHTQRRRDAMGDYARIFKASLDRRRGRSG